MMLICDSDCIQMPWKCDWNENEENLIHWFCYECESDSRSFRVRFNSKSGTCDRCHVYSNKKKILFSTNTFWTLEELGFKFGFFFFRFHCMRCREWLASGLTENHLVSVIALRVESVQTLLTGYRFKSIFYVIFIFILGPMFPFHICNWTKWTKCLRFRKRKKNID